VTVHRILFVAALVVAVLFTVAVLVRGDRPGPPPGAVLDGSDRRALDAVPLQRGADPLPADPAVDLTDPAAVARAYLGAARSAVPADDGRTRRAAVAYAAAGSPAAVGVVVLDPPPPGQARTVTVTALDLAVATEDDGRRGYRATVVATTGPVTAVTTAGVVLARQPDGRWLVVADLPELLEGDI
jgi:hypothetical protein